MTDVSTDGMTPPTWDVEPRFAGDVQTLALKGDFYHLDSAKLMPRLNAYLERCVRGGPEVILDFKRVSRMNIGLVTILLTWAAETLAKPPKPRKLVLRNVNPDWRACFDFDTAKYGHCFDVAYGPPRGPNATKG
jgi:hypothetical protein